MVERQSPLETNIHKLEDLMREQDVNMALAFNPRVTLQKRQQAKELLPVIQQDILRTFQEVKQAFKGTKPSTEIQPRARFPRSSRPQRSSTLRRQVRMSEDVPDDRDGPLGDMPPPKPKSGGRKTRRHRRNNVKKSNK